MRIKLLLFVILTLSMSGCVELGKQYESRVNSFADTSYSGGKRYFTLPGMNGVTRDDLEFKEYASYVDAALAKAGYTRSDSPAEADIAIFIAYGISDPKGIPFSYTTPDFGYTPGTTTSFKMNTRGYHDTYTTTGTAKTSGTYGITGYSTHSGVHTVYTRTLVLDACDFSEYKKSNAIKQVWKISVVSTGTSGNLRDVIPFMVQAAEDYFGTSGTATISVDANGRKRVVKN